MMFWWGFFLEQFSGGEGGEIHFILYIFSILFGGIPIPFRKTKIKCFVAAVGRGGGTPTVQIAIFLNLDLKK